MTDASRGASETELEIRRLRWQCRRGMLELDHLLDRFLDLGYRDLDQAQRLAFVRLLGEQDQRLSDWFMSRKEPADTELGDLVRHIVEVVRERPSASVDLHG
ncbi:FAD assembly factor SdhE [Thiocapsa bogorovii]|uniref:FAD assembly factor SdhE n=1 Tax=Thiocapsa bogorovii TaxID=521689 RepID=UPI001E474D83|nr:succinate dehydrogenase assembly factor 2 [Thiocapsa bogorovii]UHD17337.1 succinate dehydrogenase assembly factor 2 [Thiocapsa bogorovii]